MSNNCTKGEEEEVESNSDEERDGFFVPHGYLSEGEGDSSDVAMVIHYTSIQ